MKIYFHNYWTLGNEFNSRHIAFLNLSWQFDEYWKGIRIVIFNIGIEIGAE